MVLPGLVSLSVLVNLGHLPELLCLILVHSGLLRCLGCLLRGLGCLLRCPSRLVLLVLILVHLCVWVGFHFGLLVLLFEEIADMGA